MFYIFYCIDTIMVRRRLRSDAPIFSDEDYQYIMECRDKKPKYKVVYDLMKKYKTSSKRIYQIWRGEEASRVLWDQPIQNSEVNYFENESLFNTSLLDPQNCHNVIDNGKSVDQTKKKRSRSSTHHTSKTVQIPGQTGQIRTGSPINTDNNSLVPKQNIPEKMSVEELDAYNKREAEMDKKAIASARRILGS